MTTGHQIAKAQRKVARISREACEALMGGDKAKVARLNKAQDEAIAELQAAGGKLEHGWGY